MGPYAIEEVRRMVLAGEVPATSPAEVDNSGQWRPLCELPEFVANPQLAPPNPVMSPSPATGLNPVEPAEERTLWEGSPSQILNLRLFLIWLILLGVIGAGLYFADSWPTWSERATRQQAAMGFGALCLVALVHCLGAALNLRSTHYLVTTQRVRVTRGLLAKNMQEIELFRVKDTSASQTFFRRLFGVGDIDIVSGDANNPNLHLRAVPRAMELRESLRREVLALRQRFGVRELDVM